MKLFFENKVKLDELKEKQSPSKEDLSVLLGIINDDQELTSSFYYSNKNPNWFDLLLKADQLKGLDLSDENTFVVNRNKASYLEAVADRKPNEVLEIISELRNPCDFYVRGSFIRAIFNINEDVVAEKFNIVTKFLDSISDKQIDWFFDGEPTAKLMLKLADKYPDKAFEIAKRLVKISNDEEKSFLYARARFQPYEYNELFEKYVSKLYDKYPFESAKLLIDTFDNYVQERLKSKGSKDSSLHLYYQRIDELPDKYERDILVVIIGGICDAGKKVIEKDSQNIDKLLNYLITKKIDIYIRIAMYLLRFGGHADIVNTFISKKEYFENPCEFEYKLLLRDRFDDVADKNKKMFLSWVIEHGHDANFIQRIKDWIKQEEDREATEEDYSKHINRRMASELYLVQDKFPKEFKEYAKNSGSKESDLAPYPLVSGGPVSPSEGSPIEIDEMLKMSPNKAIDYIANSDKWPKKKNSFHSPQEGLQSVFLDYVSQKADECAQIDIKILNKIPDDFLRNYYYGMQNAINSGKINYKNIVIVIKNVFNVLSNEETSHPRYEDTFKWIVDIFNDFLRDKEEKNIVLDECKDDFWNFFLAILQTECDNDNSEEEPYQRGLVNRHSKVLRHLINMALEIKKKDEAKYENEWSTKTVEVLNVAINKNSDIVSSALWANFPQIHWLEEEWAVQYINSIFNDKNKKLWEAAWYSYVIHSFAYKDTFDLLKTEYAKAIEALDKTKLYKWSEDTDEALMKHLMRAYFNGWIDYDDKLMQEFFGKSSPQLHSKAADFLSTGFKSTKKEGEDYKEIAKRLELYWQNRIEAIKKDQSANKEEAVGFLVWAKNSLIEPKKTFELLNDTLNLIESETELDNGVHKFIDGIFELADGNEMATLKCSETILNHQLKMWHYSNYKDKMIIFIDKNVYPKAEANIPLVEQALKVIDMLGREMHWEVELEKRYKALSEKIKK